MKSSFFKTFSLSVVTALMTLSMAHAAKSTDENIEVTPTTQDVTPQELAAIYVLSEVCPKLVNQDEQFKTGYAKLTQDYLPKEKDPVTALKKMTQQKSFKSILAEAKSDARKAGNEKNKLICQDVLTYGN